MLIKTTKKKCENPSNANDQVQTTIQRKSVNDLLRCSFFLDNQPLFRCSFAGISTPCRKWKSTASNHQFRSDFQCLLSLQGFYICLQCIYRHLNIHFSNNIQRKHETCYKKNKESSPKEIRKANKTLRVIYKVPSCDRNLASERRGRDLATVLFDRRYGELSFRTQPKLCSVDLKSAEQIQL